MSKSNVVEKALRSAYFDYHRKKKIDQYLVGLKKKRKELIKELAILNRYMKKEYLDIVKLERQGLKPLFNNFLGSLEEALDKERQEYLLAVLNYQAKEREIKTLDFKAELLNQKSIELNSAEKEYKKIKHKYFLQVNLNSEAKRKKLSGIRVHVLKFEAILKEIREAEAAGKKSLNYLERLRKELSKITEWGVSKNYNEIGGKGRNSSSKKKKYINKTKQLVFKTANHLDLFELELKDVSKTLKVDFSGEIDSLQSFLKIFFDNLITDWIVKDSIEVAFLSIEMIQEKINRTKITLTHHYTIMEEKIQEWEDKATEVMLG